jgi:hypothetical protein
MTYPVGVDDVKVVQGRSTGLQVMCECGCINFNYLDPQDTLWRCRNCTRILTNDFPRLLEAAVAKHKEQTAAASIAAAAATPPAPAAPTTGG